MSLFKNGNLVITRQARSSSWLRFNAVVEVVDSNEGVLMGPTAIPRVTVSGVNGVNGVGDGG